jgi:hypothetical protein
MSRRCVLAIVLIATAAAPAPPARDGARVRVVERGTQKPVAGAIVERRVSEITICDSWRFRILGDDLLPRKKEQETRTRPEPDVPGTASTWISQGVNGRSISDASGVARFDASFEGGATLVASTATLRGACVVFVKDGETAPAEVEIEVGPPRAVEVLVVGPDGTPRAGIPVEFGRFLEDARPREHGDDPDYDDRCELWDRLGARVVTDERGSAKLVDLELHSIDDLDVLRGAKAQPFCVRALILGRTRVVAAVDPDAPPRDPVMLKLPAVGSIDLFIDLPNHRRLEVGGDVEVFAGSARLAPGYQRIVDVQRGRARIFPVESGLAGRIGVRSKVFDDGNLTATAIQLGALGDPVFGSTFLPEIESSCALPCADGERIGATLSMPIDWFQVCVRLLDETGRPLPAVEVDATLIASAKEGDGASAEALRTPRRRKSPRATSAAEGRVAFLMRRPLVPAALAVELSVPAAGGEVGGHAQRPLVFGDDLWRVDLGDVVLDR